VKIEFCPDLHCVLRRTGGVVQIVRLPHPGDEAERDEAHQDLPDLPAEILGFEPALALDGGSDGLHTFRRIAGEVGRWLAPGGGLAVELDSGCVASAAGELRGTFEGVTVRRDLAGRERIVYARKGRSMLR